MLKASELSIGVSGTRPLRKHLAKIYTRSRKLTCPHVFVKLCLAGKACRQPGWAASTIFEQYLSSTAQFISTGTQMSGSAALEVSGFCSRWRIISCLKAEFFCRKSLSRDWWLELLSHGGPGSPTSLQGVRGFHWRYNTAAASCGAFIVQLYSCWALLMPFPTI